ncbi:MAG: hypothetical protein RL398_2278 [Planctomycetota bacterium]
MLRFFRQGAGRSAAPRPLCAVGLLGCLWVTTGACVAPSRGTEPGPAAAVVTSNRQPPGGAARAAALPAAVAELKAIGYLVQPIVDVEVLNTTKRVARPADAAVEGQKPNFDVVANGTFYGGRDPVGPIVRDGVLDTGGYAICFERGGIARLRDGSIIIGRTGGGTLEQVAAAFGATADNPVEEAMGGGALLVEGGRMVSDEDLRDRQNFKQGAGGIRAAQMRKTTHSVVGMRAGMAFHLWVTAKSGAELQSELHAAGFDAVVMFDGGGAGFYDDGTTRSTARDPALTGLGITTR